MSMSIYVYELSSGGAVSALAYTQYFTKTLRYISKFVTLLHSGVLFDLVHAQYGIDGFFQLHDIKGERCPSIPH